ncbi:MAG: hypothetical protein ACE5I2_02420 [Anaerolineae bacterium]
MPQERIQVYADTKLKRRIKLAATRRNVPVTKYCLEAIKQQLTTDNMLKKKEVTIPIEEKEPKSLIDDLRVLQEEIRASRGGKPIDVDDIVHRVREERDRELLSMR